MDSKIHAQLRAMVRRYGFESVERVLREIERSRERDHAPDKRIAARSSAPKGRGPKRRRLAATDRVWKMDLPKERRTVLMEAAELFDRKLFVPSIGDVRNFWLSHGVEDPPPPSRAAAAPRRFAFLATMDMGELRKIVYHGHYSGPARMGPIADAIRDFGREHVRAWNERNGFPDSPEPVSAAGAEYPDGAADDRS